MPSIHKSNIQSNILETQIPNKNKMNTVYITKKKICDILETQTANKIKLTQYTLRKQNYRKTLFVPTNFTFKY